ncbi:MAG TPA: hypothetical protein P5565_12880, partial [Bacteroidia bacterium]|nr:hypothetical protein [Bacteroidia bacterium]
AHLAEVRALKFRDPSAERFDCVGGFFADFRIGRPVSEATQSFNNVMVHFLPPSYSQHTRPPRF